MVGPRPVAIRKFQRELLAWFDSHARDLPWRRTADPYRIWISEIMLQQTRVTAVLDYYARFLALFPTVGALASAEEPAVLAAWSGLGYYRRAKMMHQAAQVVVEEHQGALPTYRRGAAEAAGDRRVHLLGHRQHCLWRAGCGGRRQCRARAVTRLSRGRKAGDARCPGKMASRSRRQSGRTPGALEISTSR